MEDVASESGASEGGRGKASGVSEFEFWLCVGGSWIS